MNLNTLPSAIPDSVPANNVLGSDVEIKGTLRFGKELIFDGKLDGEFVSEGTLVVGRSAKVEGEIKTRTVVVHGSVAGNIFAADRCELKSTATLAGDLKAGRVLVEEGATFIGHAEVPLKLDRPVNPKPEGGKVTRSAGGTGR